MRKLLLLTIIGVAVSAFGQGSYVHDSALKVVNGVMAPIANATITVCPAAAAGIPCTPAGTLIYSDAALTQPLLNPFTSDAFGNYQFAIASGTYTVTVTATGFTGFSYQVSTPAGGASTVTWATLPGGTNSSQAFLIGTGASLGASGTGTITATHLNSYLTSFLPTNLPAGAVAIATDAASSGVCTAGGGLNNALCVWSGSVWNPAGVAAGGIVGIAASISPTATGQIASNQIWAPGFVADPAGTQNANAGGFTAGHFEVTMITYNTALGETLPSLAVSLPSGNFAACGTGCSLTITGPTLPSGVLSYNVYTCDSAVAPAVCAPLKNASCTAVSGACTITAAGAGSAVPTVNTAWVQPPNAQQFPSSAFIGGFSYLAPGVPFIWYQKRDGNYYPWLTEDWNSCDGTTGPPLPCGTPLIVGRTYFRDTATDGGFGTQQAGKNALISIQHGVASQSGTTVNTNQDRALFVDGASPTGSWSDYGREGIQVVENINGAPTYTGSPDSEDVAASLQLSDSHTNTPTSPNNAVGVLRGTVFHQTGAGGWASCTFCWIGINSQMQENSTTVNTGQYFAGFHTVGINNSGGFTNATRFVGYVANIPPVAGNRMAQNLGMWILDYTSMSANLNTDINFFSQANHPNGGYNRFDGMNEIGRVAFRNATGAGSTTCSSTGTGTSPTCAISTNSSDSGGTMTVTAGTTPSASGTFVLTYNADQAWPFTSTQCVATLSNAGTGSWNARATVIMGTTNNTSATFNWDNNAVNLTAASTYKLTYMCFGN